MADQNNANLQPHPLLTTVVLEKLFQYLEPKTNLNTLTNVRQVCSLWRDASLGWWRQIAVLKLDPYVIPNSELTTLTQMLKENPVQNYKLENVTMDVLDCIKEETHANQVWKLVGPHVKHLTLQDIELNCGDNDDLNQIIKQEPVLMRFLISCLPNLTALEVCNIRKNYNLNRLHENDGSLFEMHPNLKSLKTRNVELSIVIGTNFANFPNLKELDTENLDWFWSMEQNDQGFEDYVINSSLEKLYLTFNRNLEINETILSALKLVRLSALQCLSVNVRTHRHNIKFLPVFLMNHAKQLKTLHLTCRPFVPPMTNFNCQFDQLTELRLWGNVVEDLSFLKLTPKLKVLHMDVYCLEKWNEPHRPMHMHSLTHDIVDATVKGGDMEGVELPDLYYLQINCGFSMRNLKSMGEWMPNLKTLRTVLWPESVAVICEQWPQVEHLIGMHGSTLTDEDIIGTDGSVAGLASLVELKTFHLKATCNEGQLTDQSVHKAFLKMDKLTDLQVCVNDQFSVEAEMLLKDKVWNVNVIRNYNGNTHHRNYECCKCSKIMEILGLPWYDGGYSDATMTSEEENEDDWDDDGNYDDSYDVMDDYY